MVREWSRHHPLRASALIWEDIWGDMDAENPTRNAEPLPQSRQLAAFAYFLVALSGLFLLIARRDDDFVRFHALQSIVGTLGFVLLGLVLRFLAMLPLLGFLYDYLFKLFLLAVFVYWVFLMVRAYQGVWERIPYVGRIVESQISN